MLKTMTTINKILKASILEKTVYILLVVLIIIVLYNSFNVSACKKEGFRVNKTYVYKTDNDIFDDFYASIYDVLVYNKIRNQFEIGSIIDTTSPNSESIILDISTRTGHHVNQLNNITTNVIGIDTSIAMINKSRQNYPTLEFAAADPLDNQAFQPNSFTHILALNNNIYYLDDKKMFFNNCYNWLMTGGYLIISLTDREQLNPINTIINIKSNLLPSFVDPTLLIDKTVKFKDFSYKPDYKPLGKDIVVLNERFKYNNGDIRENEHKLYIKDKPSILKMATNAGFIVLKMYDLKEIGFNSYMYVLQK